MATSYQKDLLTFLGPEYSIREIDLEPCIYRKINDKYDIEISGTTRRNRPLGVYVWDISKGSGAEAVIVEKHIDVSNPVALKILLNDLVKKYQDSV